MSGLRDQLQAIYDARGTLTPTVVLNEARDPQHPLHSRFEWDDSVAAEKYRVEQAHELIRSVRVSYVATDGPTSIRAFQAVRRPSGYVYEPSEVVVRDQVATQLVLNEMERDWRQLKARYEQFSEFATMVKRDLSAAA